MAIFVPEEKIFEIKNTADIVEVVSETVLLKKAGKNYLGLCPFHSEKTPSFTVNPEKQIFYCFGCGAGGNVFSFVMKQENLSFPEAAHMLARRYGIEIPTHNLSPQQKKRISERESLFEINKQAMVFFRYVLSNSAAGEKARAYLKKRKVSDDIINGFGLGYAPVGWDNVVNFFSKKRISEVLVEKSGLIVARNKNHTQRKNGFYDRFRDRIIFPVFDVSMRVIGFGGRVLDDSLPKYLNSPETPLYNKSRSLYGLHKAKQKCRETNTVYIVEGYFDLLSLFQHGISNAVATLGTSLTVEHVRLLKGYAGRFILVYDSDEAGIKAAQRSIDIFMKEGVDVRIIVLPVGYDPDSYLLEFGSGSFKKAAANALGVMPFLMKSALKKHGLSIEGKINIMSDLKAPLAAISDSVARSLYIKKAAELIGIDETAVLEKIRNVTAEKKVAGEKRVSNFNVSPIHGKTMPLNRGNGKVHPANWSRLEKQIIAMMLQFPEILYEISNRNILEYFENDTLKSIGGLILKHKSGTGRQVSDLVSFVQDKEQRRIIASLAIGEDCWDNDGCMKLIEQFVCSRNRNGNSLLQKIKAAEESHDNELLLKLLTEKQIQAGKKR